MIPIRCSADSTVARLTHEECRRSNDVVRTLNDEHMVWMKQDGIVLRFRIEHQVYWAQAVLSEETRQGILLDVMAAAG